VHDDKTGSRGQSGSSSDQDGLGIPSRSAPASIPDESSATLIAAIERELDLIKFWNAPLMTHDAIRTIFKAGQKWLDGPRGSQFLPSPGRPSLEDRDAQVLLDLRAANPGSDCWREFCLKIGAHLGVKQQRRRYNRACRNIARKAGLEDKYKDCVIE
jgi:hypothetical protein